MKNKKIKKILSLFVCFAMLMAIIPTSVFAETEQDALVVEEGVVEPSVENLEAPEELEVVELVEEVSKVSENESPAPPEVEAVELVDEEVETVEPVDMEDEAVKVLEESHEQEIAKVSEDDLTEGNDEKFGFVKITKIKYLDVPVYSLSPEKFEFTMYLDTTDGAVIPDKLVVVDTDTQEPRSEIQVVDNKINFELKFNETITIRIPVGVKYFVSEKEYEKYDTYWHESTSAFSPMVEPQGWFTEEDVESMHNIRWLYCRNTPVLTYTLGIAKAFNYRPSVPVYSLGPNDDVKFEFVVELTAPEGRALWNEYEVCFNEEEYTTLKVDDNKLTFELGFEEYVEIYLPVGTSYHISEVESNKYALENWYSGSYVVNPEGILFNNTYYVCSNNVVPRGGLSISKLSEIPKPKPPTPPNPPVYSLEKTLKQSNEKFEFEILLTAPDGQELWDEYEACYNDNYDNLEMLKVEDGKITVLLGFDETINIGLPYGTEYTVNEKKADGYVTTWLTDNSGIITEENNSARVLCLNEKIVNSLTVKHTVSGNAADPYKDFHFTINLKDEAGQPIDSDRSFKMIDVEGNLVTFHNGDTITLKHGEEVVIFGLDPNTQYTITINEYSEDGYLTSSQDITGVTTEDGALAHIHNEKYKTQLVIDKSNYAPRPVPVYSNEAKLSNIQEAFEFTVELVPEEGQELLDEYEAVLYKSYYSTEGDIHREVYIEEEVMLSQVDGKIEFKLGFSDYIEITIPQGTQYIITEKEHPAFETSWYRSTTKYPEAKGVMGENAIEGKTYWTCVNLANREYSVLMLGKVEGPYVIEPSPELPPANVYSLTNEKFVFTIELNNEAGLLESYPFIITEDMYNGELGFIEVEDGKIVFELGFNEVAMMYLPIGTEYTISEAASDYLTSWIIFDENNPQEPQLNNPSGVIVDGPYSNQILCINEKLENFLVVKHDVSGNDADTTKEFGFTINLKDVNGNAIDSNKSFRMINQEGNLVEFHNGDTILLAHNEEVVILDLETGYNYIITINEYSEDGYETTIIEAIEGSISKEGSTAHIHNERNVYPELSLSVKKLLTIDGELKEDLTATEFKFEIKSDEENPVDGAELTNDNVSISLPNEELMEDEVEFGNIKFVKGGLFRFFISEVQEEKGGFTYDDKVRVLEVVISEDAKTIESVKLIVDEEEIELEVDEKVVVEFENVFTPEVEKVKVEYEIVGENPGVDVPELEELDKGTAYDSKEMPKSYKDKDGNEWLFDGWYLDKELKEAYKDGTIIEKDTILYGKFTKQSKVEEKPTPKPENKPQPKPESKPPHTGDENNLGLYIGILAASVIVLGGIIFVIIKKKKSNKQ